MRRLIIAFWFWTCTVFSMQAQDTTHVPFFKADCFESDAYFEFQAVVSQYAKSAAGFTGFGLHWVVNHKFVVGAQGFLLASGESLDKFYTIADTVSDPPLSKFYSAGLSFGYVLFPQKKFSFHPELYAGWGMFKYQPEGAPELSRHLGVLWPKVQGTWNAHKHFRLGVGLGYRAVVGKNIDLLKSTQLGGVTGQVFLRVGTF